ncbi:hypothetical protein [Clostridium tyrobutyricum]|uniref:hypothetical protein n=1 Tax=Clostridium tyrobutyricum TaxID=1519 RepID=UPI002B1F4C88|nr:hypothetical protein [Clostridium tyrobutyricum]MEA5008212.1 hypothetical protein [Clostridium tyrobutyricum]
MINDRIEILPDEIKKDIENNVDPIKITHKIQKLRKFEEQSEEASYMHSFNFNLEETFDHSNAFGRRIAF